MITYALRFEVDPPTDREALEAAFYDHFDGLLAESFGRWLVTIYLDGHRNGVSAAKCAAMELKEKLGVMPRRMDRDLVDAAEIARRIGRSRESIRQLISGERRKGMTFPAPVGSPNGKRIWEWGTVNEWLRSTLPGEGDNERYLSRDECAIVDAWILRWATMPRDQHVRTEFFEITASEATHSEPRRRSRHATEAWVSSWNVSGSIVQKESLPSSKSG
ncbi:helix-turn-helix transcriptional regulator [Streptomyces sp. F-7]|uniref:helix-turn-helix transcriptional regulator n=1 Tax=Streptomyces sp. F-7 TaxID=573566 RepID=UPI0011477D8D|nr:hypothetical protein [Streptomyces sp. F-7]